MKFSYTFKNDSLAKRFEEALKERNIKSLATETDDDGCISVSYAIDAGCSQEEKDSYSKQEIDERIYSIVYRMSEYIMEEFQWQMNWISSELDYLYSSFYKHQQGHIPPITSPSQMQAALDALGLSEDYEVQKKVIYAKEGITVKNLS